MRCVDVFGIQFLNESSALRTSNVVRNTIEIHIGIIGASLSKPHTSRTALRRCVCIRPCLWSYTVNFKYAKITKIERPHERAWHGNAGLLPDCSVDNRSGDDSILSMHGTLLLVCHSSYGPTINGQPYKTIHARLRSIRIKLRHIRNMAEASFGSERWQWQQQPQSHIPFQHLGSSEGTTCTIWTPHVGEKETTVREPGNERDRFTAVLEDEMFTPRLITG